MRRLVAFGSGAALAVFVIAAAAAATRPLPAFERVMTMSAPRDVGDLALTDQDGKQVHIRDFAGTPTLVYFGFTSCSEVCPTTLAKLGRLKAANARELSRLRVAFISVDGERDTPAVTKEFVRRFSSDMVGLTAPAAEVRPLALRFAAPFFKDPPKDGKYLVQHSTRVYALDKQGRLRAELYDASAEATLGVARALLAE
jgi:protein SCO1